MIERHARIGSTMERAVELARSGAPAGTVVLAEEQSAGRGRLGRSWVSPPGGLWFSVVLNTSGLEAGSPVAICVAAAVARILNDAVRIDWPNDLMVGDKKVGGILVEGSVEGPPSDFRYAWLVAGIGINVAVDAADLPPEGASLGRSTAQREPLLQELLIAIDGDLQKLASGEPLVDQWRSLCQTLGQKVRIQFDDGRILEGRAIEIRSDGALLVHPEEGPVVPVFSCYRCEVLRA